MRGVKITACLVLGLMLIMPLVFATTTEIQIKTMPFREVQVAASTPTTYKLIQNFKNKSDQYGDISFTLDFTIDAYDLYLYIKEEGNTLVKDRKVNLVTGEPQYFELATPGFVFLERPDTEKVVEETEVNVSNNESEDLNDTEEVVDEEVPDTEEVLEENLETEDTEAESLITKIAGSVVATFNSNRSIIVYVVGGIVLVGGIGFFFMRRRGSKTIDVERPSGRPNQQTILDVEQKLKSIQDELDGMN